EAPDYKGEPHSRRCPELNPKGSKGEGRPFECRRLHVPEVNPAQGLAGQPHAEHQDHSPDSHSDEQGDSVDEKELRHGSIPGTPIPCCQPRSSTLVTCPHQPGGNRRSLATITVVLPWLPR